MTTKLGKVEPEAVGFLVPCKGQDDSMVKVRIRNTTKQRITHKMKLTQPERFRISPIFGFTDPDSETIVRIKPLPFDDTHKLNSNDRFTVLLSVAPKGAQDAKEFWKRGSATEPKSPEKVVVKVKYCKTKDKMPPGLVGEEPADKEETEEEEEETDEGDEDEEDTEETDEDEQGEDEEGED